MAFKTSSIAWPNMINVARNCISVYEDNRSITNRTKLLMLTDPTELYNMVDQGVGLKRYLWQYNTPNTAALVKERIKDQLRKYEPCVYSEKTSFADGLLYTGTEQDEYNPQRFNQLKMTVGLSTIFGDTVDIDTNDVQQRVDAGQEYYKAVHNS